MLFPEPLSIPARTRNQRTWKKPIMYLLFLERLEFYRFLLLFGEQSVRECGTGGVRRNKLQAKSFNLGV